MHADIMRAYIACEIPVQLLIEAKDFEEYLG